MWKLQGYLNEAINIALTHDKTCFLTYALQTINWMEACITKICCHTFIGGYNCDEIFRLRK